jgi:hypothetical protein
MNIKHIAASIAALTILAGGPTIVLAANVFPSDPIVISDFNVQPSDLSDGFGPGFVSMDFQNTSQVVATEVVFELDVDGARVERFNDIGTFLPGSSSRHAFMNSSERPDAQLKVAKVKFADGSVWVPTTITADDDQ